MCIRSPSVFSYHLLNVSIASRCLLSCLTSYVTCFCSRFFLNYHSKLEFVDKVLKVVPKYYTVQLMWETRAKGTIKKINEGLTHQSMLETCEKICNVQACRWTSMLCSTLVLPWVSLLVLLSLLPSPFGGVPWFTLSVLSIILLLPLGDSKISPEICQSWCLRQSVAACFCFL